MTSGGIVDCTLWYFRGAVWPPGADRLYQDLQNSVCRLDDHKVQGKAVKCRAWPVEYGELSSENCLVLICRRQ
jgi:hypothetical protein